MRRLKRIIKRLTNFRRWIRQRDRVPGSWKEVTLEQFIQMNDLPTTPNRVTDFINKVSVLTTLHEDEIRAMNGDEIERLNKRLSFLSGLPEPRKIKSFNHGGKVWKRNNVELCSVAEVTDILQMNQNETNVGAKILNVLSVLFYYDDEDDEHSSDRFKKNKAELLSLDFPTALSSSVFFSTGLRTYFPDVIRDYLKTMTGANLERLTEEIGNDFDLKDLGKFINGTTSSTD